MLAEETAVAKLFEVELVFVDPAGKRDRATPRQTNGQTQSCTHTHSLSLSHTHTHTHTHTQV
jgi:hypothetical protein